MPGIFIQADEKQGGLDRGDQFSFLFNLLDQQSDGSTCVLKMGLLCLISPSSWWSQIMISRSFFSARGVRSLVQPGPGMRINTDKGLYLIQVHFSWCPQIKQVFMNGQKFF